MKKAVVCMLSVLCLVSAGFTDVVSGSWYESAVVEMHNKGLVNGYPDGTFRPSETITAAEFVSITARCSGLEYVSSSVSAHWAGDVMSAALSAGWYDWDEIPPDSDSYDSPITRDVAVKILMRAMFPDAHGDYLTESAKMSDFASLSGRYYDTVLAAYSLGIVNGDENGRFNPRGFLTRAESCAIFSRALSLSDTARSETVTEPVSVSGGVSENGKLHVEGTRLCNERGETVVLRGMSSHGMQWYSEFTNKYSVAKCAELGANVFRVAMYTCEGGYIDNPHSIEAAVISAVDNAIECDMYVIIDWHILSDGNPQTYKSEALAFFERMAYRYRDSPAVLYEVCNEPNGNVSWDSDIKPYERDCVSVIRRYTDAVILLGSGSWSQNLNDAVRSPLEGVNLMYTLHFYAGTHGDELRSRVDTALNAGLAVFVSEWGMSRSDGGGGVYVDAAETWLDFLDARSISWCNWSLCDKNESSAALKSGATATSWTESDLSESGAWVFSRM